MPSHNNNNNTDADYIIKGAHGTIAEQTDEAYYDDRSDASDDIEKGRLKFPEHMYGRERELETLQGIYKKLDASSTNVMNRTDKEQMLSNTDLYSSHVVFLSGYSGIGKTALVNEFVKKVQNNYQSSDGDDITAAIMNASGKYTEQSTSSAPFSAITEVLDKLISEITQNEEQYKAICKGMKESDFIGPDETNILLSTFPNLAPIINFTNFSSRSSIQPTMNAIKECARELLSIICTTIQHPMIIFIDDCQWADGASLDMLSLLLSCTKLRTQQSNILFICAYRSNEIDDDHPFTNLMNEIIIGSGSDSVEKMDLFNLSPDAITRFIADSIKKEDDDGGDVGVSQLSEAVYQKTMGNIFFTIQALEELVRKNVLFYDVMCFEWCFVASKVELADSMSDDVVTMVKSKIRDLSVDIQQLLIVMSYIPNSLDVAILKRLMDRGDMTLTYDLKTIKDLLKGASYEGMLLFSTDSKCHIFAHDRIRQASHEIAAERDDRDEMVLHIAQILQEVADQQSEMEWCLYVAVDLLNSLPPEQSIYSDDTVAQCLRTSKLQDLVKLNVRVSRIAGSRGSAGRENELLHEALSCLVSSGKVWKEYDQTLELYNAVIVSDHSLGKFFFLHARL